MEQFEETRTKSHNQIWDDYQAERKRRAELLLKIERLEVTIRLREKEIELLNKKLKEVLKETEIWRKGR